MTRMRFARRRPRRHQNHHRTGPRRIEELEDRLLLATFSVTNTNDTGTGSLREAINLANAATNAGGPDRIEFNIAATDPGHVYYQNDGVAGQVTTANIAATSATTDAAIADIDPDWPHSWFSIQPATALPEIADAVEIDGLTQPGAGENTNTVASGLGLDAVLRIEIDGSGGAIDGLMVQASGSTFRGLAINRFSDSAIHLLAPFSDVNNVTVQGNFLGTDISGTIGLGGQTRGVFLHGHSFNDPSNNMVGGLNPEDRNLISSNLTGVDVFNSGNGNVIQGNLFGTDRTGTTSLGANNGVAINGPSNTLIGGASPGARNVFSGNSIGVGVISGFTLGTTIQGNYFGLDVSGTQPLGNGTGIRDEGNGTRIGGPGAGEGNVVAASSTGILLTLNTKSAVIQGNLIGTDKNGVSDPDGTPGNGDELGNTLGIQVGTFGSGAQDNLVGGTGPGEGNLIAGNTTGVRVEHFQTSGNSILGNSIFGNSGLGIDLVGGTEDAFGVTANDAGDGDTGPNDLQNYPVITTATSDTTTSLEGFLTAPGNTTFRIEFFTSSAMDASGYGEGENFLASIDVTTNILGDAPFAVTGLPAVPAGHVVTATATDPAGNTSEFSAAITPSAPCPGDVVVDATTSQSFLDSLTHVCGSVVADNAVGLTQLDLPNLTTIDGDLIITDNPDLTLVETPLLVDVGGSVNISNNDSAGSVDLGSAVTIGGDLIIDDNDSAADIDVGLVVDVGGSVNISNNDSAGSVDLGSAVTIGGDLMVDDNDSATSIDVGGVVDVGGNVDISNNGSVMAVDIGGLTAVDGNLIVSENDSAGLIDVGGVVTVGGNMIIVGNDLATNIDVVGVTDVGGNVDISDNGSVMAVDIGGLTAVGGNLIVSENDSAMSIDVGGVGTVGGNMSIVGNDLATNIDVVGVTDVGGNVEVSLNPNATSINLGNLGTPGGDVSIVENDGATFIDLGGLQTAGGSVQVSLNPNAASINLGGLGSAGGDVSIVDNDGATSINLGGLGSAGGDVVIVGNPSATSIDLGSLGTAGGAVSVVDNDGTTSIDLGSLGSAGGDVSIVDNDGATSINLGGLGSAGGDVVIVGNPSATSIDLGGLGGVVGNLDVSGNSAVASLVLPNLVSVGAGVNISNNDALVMLDLGAMVSVFGDLSVDANLNLGSLNLPSLTDIGGDLAIDDNGNPTVSWTSLTPTVGGAATLGEVTVALADSTFAVTDTLTVSDGATLSMDDTSTTSASTIRLLPGASATGTGTLVAVTVISSGFVLPGASPGKLTVQGNYHQSPGGTLVVEIGGTVPVVEHDVFAVEGNAIFEGIIRFVFIDGFVPQPGDTFQVLDVSGTLDVAKVQTQVENLPAGLSVDVDPAGGSVHVEAAAASLPAVVRGNRWHLRGSLTTGPADIVFTYGFVGDIPMFGDWDGDGVKTPGVYRGNWVLLRNSNSTGFADIAYRYGFPGDRPIVGDWDGDGVDSLGVVRGNRWLLRNGHSTGIAEIAFTYGLLGDAPIVGDWDGNGTDTPGVVREKGPSVWWLLRHSNTTGFAEQIFDFGAAGDRPIVGDWDGDGVATAGVIRESAKGVWWLAENRHETAPAELMFDYGLPGDTQLVWSSGPSETRLQDEWVDEVLSEFHYAEPLDAGLLDAVSDSLSVAD